MYEKPSSMVSDYHRLFSEWGYEQLDVVFYEDRSWSIIEYQNSPIIPSLTKWKLVLSNMENIEFSESFVKKMVKSLDLQRQEFWDNIEAQERKAQEEREGQERARSEQFAYAASCLERNPALMSRAAEQGEVAFSMTNILRHLSPTQVKNVLGPSVQIFH